MSTLVTNELFAQRGYGDDVASLLDDEPVADDQEPGHRKR
jgi:hypothetical protein